MSISTRETPSPNHEPRPAGCAVDMLILHYTGMATGKAALDRLRDPAAKVSAHYLIETDGTIHALVPEYRRAWHAGVAAWAGARNVNDRSIGIELVNPGHAFGYRPFPEAQIASLTALAQDIVARHPIPAHAVLGHSDIAPARKEDPGELFDWPRLAAEGLGVWPRPAQAPVRVPEIEWFQRGMAWIGYDVPTHGTFDRPTRQALAAFQRHFRPEAVTGTPDAGTAERLLGLHHTLEGPLEAP